MHCSSHRQRKEHSRSRHIHCWHPNALSPEHIASNLSCPHDGWLLAQGSACMTSFTSCPHGGWGALRLRFPGKSPQKAGSFSGWTSLGLVQPGSGQPAVGHFGAACRQPQEAHSFGWLNGEHPIADLSLALSACLN